LTKDKLLLRLRSLWKLC